MHQCPVCAKIFSRKYCVKRHLAGVHKIMNGGGQVTRPAKIRDVYNEIIPSQKQNYAYGMRHLNTAPGGTIGRDNYKNCLYAKQRLIPLQQQKADYSVRNEYHDDERREE